jgi:single-stranded DNA-binding protein
MSYEKIILTGNIGATELLSSNAGNPYIKMSVAVNRGSRDSIKTIWYSVLLFGKLAENGDRLKVMYGKGRTVLVEGRPQVEAYLRKDGSVGLDNTIVATMHPELLDFNTGRENT